MRNNILRRIVLIFLFILTYINTYVWGASAIDENKPERHALLICSFSLDSPVHRKILEDIKSVKKLSLISTESDISDSKRAEYARFFDVIIPIKDEDYSNTGMVEQAAIDLFRERPYGSIIASWEKEILVAGRLRSLLDIEGQSYESSLAFRDKVIMKEILARGGIRVPRFIPLESYPDLYEFTMRQGFPLVVKPSRRWGSDKTFVLKEPSDLAKIAADPKVFNLAHSGGYEAEEFIDGNTYHIDGIIHNGEIRYIWPSAYINQCIDLVSSKAIGGHMLEPTDPRVPRLMDFTKHVLGALPTPANTGFHLEAFISKADEIVLCEVGSRIGGAIREPWVKAFGIDLTSIWWKMQAGVSIEDELARGHSKPSTIAGWIFYPVRLGTIVEVPSAVPFSWVGDYYVDLSKIGKLITVLNNMDDSYLLAASLIANSEREFKERFQLLVEWLDTNIKWHI